MGRRLRGGHRFPRFQGEPADGIREQPPPGRAIVPLRQGIFVKGQTQRTEFQAELPPLVKPGDRVKAGTIIARDDEKISTPLHSPVSGEVVAIEERAHPWGGRSPAVVIEADGQDRWKLLDRHDPEGLEAEELQEILYKAGVTDGGNGGFPTEFNSSPAKPEEIKYLIIDAVDDEPYLRFQGALLGDDIEGFIAGAAIMRRALGGPGVHLGIGGDGQGLVKAIRERAPDWLRIAPLPPRYPQGDEETLIRTILGIEVPPGGISTDVGVTVQDVAHVLAAYEAVHQGRPFIERPISVGGAVGEPGIFRVRPGTPLSELVSIEGGVRVMLDGALRGFPIESPKNGDRDLEIPVLRNTRGIVALPRPAAKFLAWSEPGFARDSFTKAFLALPWRARKADFGLHGPERPCVKCGFCLEACPQGLAPAMLAEYAAHDLLDEAEGLNILACIECGLCAYVCPAKIPLLEQIRAGKRKIWEATG
jgi:electron transport complex protein RnfC